MAIGCPIIPRSSFGDPECCGCLLGRIRGDQADIVCNECGAVVRKVAATELEHTLTEIKLTLDVAVAVYSHCGATHLAPGFSKLDAFICDECGESATVADLR